MPLWRTSLALPLALLSLHTLHRFPVAAVAKRVCTMSTSARTQISTLTQVAMGNIDQELMSTPGFSIDQLMELAGLAVAISVTKGYSVETHSRVLVVAGPGNNGGDALIAARHLKHFKYSPTILYPKTPRKNVELFENIIAQCEAMDITILKDVPSAEAISSEYDVIVDGIFGFSFKGAPRAPFDAVLANINESKLPVAAVDIPSGWDVNEGDTMGVGVNADMLISLTAPKPCALHFSGRYHFVGGRFVPPRLAAKYGLVLPEYPGIDQVVDVSSGFEMVPAVTDSDTPGAGDGTGAGSS